MRWLIGLVVVLGISGAPAFAQSGKRPWEEDTRAFQAASKDVANGGGLNAVGKHAALLEAALSHMASAYEAAQTGDKQTRYVLTDGMGEAFIAMSMIKSAGEKRSVVAIDNPYPKIAFYLGSYYDEIGKPQDAVRVLEIGLGIAGAGAVAGSDAAAIRFFSAGGDTEPVLRIEYGAALGQVKRFADALAAYDAGLAIPDVDDKYKAVMLRGRGSSLTDLNRLDEAEAAYRESLKIAPNNPVALHELQYIAGLRAGSKPTESGLTKVETQTK